MHEEIEVDSNLLYLRNILISLGMFKFDEDVMIYLNSLKNLIDKKIYSSLKTNKDILDVKYKIIFYFNNK